MHTIILTLLFLKFVTIISFASSHNLPEYLEAGFPCAVTEEMEPKSYGSFQQGNNSYTVQVWLPNGRKCFFAWETLARRFGVQARKGPDFVRRIGMMIKITDAVTHCDELAAMTHKTIQPRSEVQLQWARMGAELPDKLMFRAIILDEEKWYSVNATIQDCRLVNECASNPCVNGMCKDMMAFYICKCLPGFTGSRCELEIMECHSDPCKYGGTCIEGLNEYRCECRDGFTGHNCETDLEKPEISCPADDILEYPDPPTNIATAEDNSGSFRINYTDRTVGGTPPEVEVLRTWTATDGSGNMDSCTTTYKYQDTRKPVIDCPSKPLVSEYPVPQIPPNASDSSGLPLTFNFTEWTEQIGHSFDKLLRNWTAKDLSRNTASCIMSYYYSAAGFDCADIKSKDPKKQSGVYVIKPENRAMLAYCDMEIFGGGWTVFQRRLTGEVNFGRNWMDYRKGFGNVTMEHWLGNDALHSLTKRGQELVVELREPNSPCFIGAWYQFFHVASEQDNYKLSLHRDFFGFAGNSLSYHHGMNFSTFDRDNDKSSDINCAKIYNGGWWYNGYGYCEKANLNGLYHSGCVNVPGHMNWDEAHGWFYSFQQTEMKVRAADFDGNQYDNWCRGKSCQTKCKYDKYCQE